MTAVVMIDCLQAGSDLYAFVEFEQHSDAQLALMAMNKRIVLGRVSLLICFTLHKSGLL